MSMKASMAGEGCIACFNEGPTDECLHWEFQRPSKVPMKVSRASEGCIEGLNEGFTGQ